MSKTLLLAGAALLVIAGSGAFLYSSGQASNVPLNIQSMASTTGATVATTSASTSTEAYTEHLESVAEQMIEKEYGVPVKAVTAKPTRENVAGKKWVLTIPVNSLNSDVALTESNGETHWMDQVRFDSELTAYENKENAGLPELTATWQAIIGRDDLAQQMVAEIQNTYAPIWQNKLQDLTKIKDGVDGVATIFTSRFGADIASVPDKYRAAAQYNLDLKSVVTDNIYLTELNLKVKQETIKAVQGHNVDAAVTAANDEDRITLVASWYDERIGILMQKDDEVSASLRALIAEYPR